MSYGLPYIVLILSSDIIRLSDKEKEKDPPKSAEEAEPQLPLLKGSGKFIVQELDKIWKETTNNILKSLELTGASTPSQSEAAVEYQSNTLELTRELTKKYLDRQKDVLESILLPYLEGARNVTKQNVHHYSTALKDITENMARTTGFTNDILRSNLEAYKRLTRDVEDAK